MKYSNNTAQHQNGSAQLAHSILLGSVGGDSHSVGLLILKAALEARGWRVIFLSTQNKLEDFFELANAVNLVMISCMDGHAWHYLNEFPKLQQKYKSHALDTIWYLGGNLTIGDSIGQERKYLELGFSKVFPKFVDVEVVLNLIERDLNYLDPRNLFISTNNVTKNLGNLQNHSFRFDDEVVDEDFFFEQRSEILEQWKTGRDAFDLSENAHFLKSCPNFSQVQYMSDISKSGILVQPRAGVTLPNEQLKLFKAFAQWGAKTLSFQVDSLTRNNNYVSAELAVREASKGLPSTLNGFPVVNHGVRPLRKIASELKVPLQVRHSTRDPRLLAEISLAGGVTAYEGGAICYNVPYYKCYSLEESIERWQYVDRLCGVYFEEFGIIIDREYFGVLTGTLIPPAIAIVSSLLEAILSVQQGVRSVSLGYAEQGNRSQDIAAIQVMEAFSKKTLGNMGYNGVRVFSVFSQYMAAFPNNLQLAENLIYNSAITAHLSGATRLMVKTPVEAFKIPSLSDNIEGLNLVHRAIENADSHKPNLSTVQMEYDLITKEVEAIFESVLFAGKGSVTKGIVAGFKQGLLDIPFAPSVYNAGKVMTARDCDGAIRYLSTGNLAFSKDVKEFHQHKIAERCRREGLMSKRQQYKLIEKDVLQVARGQYDHWPLKH